MILLAIIRRVKCREANQTTPVIQNKLRKGTADIVVYVSNPVEITFPCLKECHLDICKFKLSFESHRSQLEFCN